MTNNAHDNSGIPHPHPAADHRHTDAAVSQVIFNVVGGITAALVLVVGIILLTGSLLPESVPANYRTILGVVMVVYGTYRIIMLWMKYRRSRSL